MSISTTTRKAGPYTGNDAAASFTFAFKVFAAADVLVTQAVIATGAESTLTLTADYTVALNADQDNNPGGTVTLVAGPLASTATLTLTSRVAETQPAVFTNLGGFYPAVLNGALDRLTVLVQQLSERVGRALKLAVSTPAGFNATLPAPVPYSVLGFNSAGTGFQTVDPTGTSALAADLASSAVGKGSAMVASTLRKTGAVSITVEKDLNALPNLYKFGAKCDGVADDLEAYYAAIQSGEPRILIPWGTGTGVITEEILIQDRDSIELIFPRGFTLKCVGSYRSGRAGIKLDNASNILIHHVNIRGFRVGWTGVMADADNAPIDFGIYSTSTGTGAAGNNRFFRCDANYVRNACFQIGNADSGIIDETTDEHQLIYCSGTFAPYGVAVGQSNTNMTRIEGGWMTNYSVDGIHMGNNARGIMIDGVMFYTFFGGRSCMYIAKEQSGPIDIRNVVTEQYQGAWLMAEPTSAGLSSFSLLSIDNCNVTNNDTTAGQKLIDYRAAGSVHIRNSRFGGAGSLRAGGVGAKLSFQPANASIGGMQSLITEQVELYDGATWDVQTDNATGWMRWIDTLTTIRGAGVNSGSGDPSTPLIRERGRINHEIQNLPALALAAGGTQKSYGKVGQGWWKVTVGYAAFTAASTTANYYFVTIPPKCRVLGIYADTTTPFAGLAGTITVAIKNGATALLNAHDVKTAAVTKGLASGDLGTVMTTGLVQGAYIPTWTAGGVQLNVELVSGTGNVGNGTVTNLTAGSIDVYLLVDVPPTY